MAVLNGFRLIKTTLRKLEILAVIFATVGIVGAMSLKSANAAILDFTDISSFEVTNGSFAGTTYTITSNPAGQVTWNKFQDGSSCIVLACNLDGLGVTDDEVSSTGSESITITFAQEIAINGVYFLDLFTSITEPSHQEIARVTYSTGSMDILSDPNQIPNGMSGYLFFALEPNITTSFLTFTAPDTGFLGNDGLGVNDFAVAAISAVPLPAALPLFFAALGGFGLMSRRRKLGVETTT